MPRPPNTRKSNARKSKDVRSKGRKDADSTVALVADLNRQKAIDLKKARVSYRKIATILGVALSTAYKYVNDGWERVNEETDESRRVLRAMEEDDLDAMAEVVRPLATDPNIYVERVVPGEKGKATVVTEHDADVMFKAVDRLVKINARRAEIRGTDAPKKIEQTGSVNCLEPLSVLAARIAEHKAQNGKG